MSFALGLLAVTAAPSLMVLGFIVWDNHWSGSAFALNMFKCNLATIGFIIVSLALPNQQWDASVFSVENVGFLMFSSTIGILIGDWTWLEGMRILGARKVIVMDCLKPFFAVLVGKIYLGEELAFPAYVGLLLTILGVTVVALDKDKFRHDHDEEDETTSHSVEFLSNETDSLLIRPDTVYSLAGTLHNHTFERMDSYVEQRRKGEQSIQILFYGWMNAFLNVVLHTVGASVTKKYGAGMSTWQINMIRFGFAGISMAVLSFGLTMSNKFFVATTTAQMSATIGPTVLPWYSLPSMIPSSWINVSSGVFCVTFLHPALVNYAMFQVPLALLLTLDSIGPLYSLPLSWVLQKEQPTCKACLGALMAVGGIIVLCFRGMAMQ
jgi:drug/metabolite transporter (DMT)-like permease